MKINWYVREIREYISGDKVVLYKIGAKVLGMQKKYTLEQ